LLVDGIVEVPTSILGTELDGLDFVQSGDVITFVHHNYVPSELRRLNSNSLNWSLDSIAFGPTIAEPTGVAASGTGNGFTAAFFVSSISDETGEESLAVQATHAWNGSSSLSVSWTPASGATYSNVYAAGWGTFGVGFLGIGTNTFIVPNPAVQFPDPLNRPPLSRLPFNSSDNYPSAVAYIEQRLTFGNTENNPEGVWMSQVGRYHNFCVGFPATDDEAVTFSMAGQRVAPVQHLMELGKPLVFTDSGEHALGGNDAEMVTPGAINPRQQSANGSTDLKPLLVDGSALYVQAMGNVVRDLAFEFQVDGYRGSDLTIFASHLFKGETLVDWCYQQIPDSIVWGVRSDGELLGMTYVKEQQIFGWHHHDTQGLFENCCSVPESGGAFILTNSQPKHSVYFVVVREIDGATVRYIERMTDRFPEDPRDLVLVDSAVTVDGRTLAYFTPLKLTGSVWTKDSLLTLNQIDTAFDLFSAADVDNEFWLTGVDGELVRCKVITFTDVNTLQVRVDADVPTSMQAVDITDWERAVSEVTGLDHLEGEEVAVYADGYVVASPNNANVAFTATVSSGAITLDRCYSVIHVGLPYTCDLETLDIDIANGESILDQKKLINKVAMIVEESRGIWAGPQPPDDDDENPLQHLFEAKIRNRETYDSPVALKSGLVEIQTSGRWNANGRVFVRQVDPLPLTVLSIAPAGIISAA
jgi:hypothetical protein